MARATLPLSGAEARALLTVAGRCAIKSAYRQLGDKPFITLDPRMPPWGAVIECRDHTREPWIEPRGFTAAREKYGGTLRPCCGGAPFAAPCRACSKSDGARLDQADFPLTEVLSCSMTQMRSRRSA